MTPVDPVHDRVIVRKARPRWSRPVIAALTVFFGAIITILALRFILMLFGIDAVSGPVNFIHSAAAVLMLPFGMVFLPTDLEGMTVEWNTLFAIGVYTLIAWVALTGVELYSRRLRDRAVDVADADRDA